MAMGFMDLTEEQMLARYSVWLQHIGLQAKEVSDQLKEQRPKYHGSRAKELEFVYGLLLRTANLSTDMSLLVKNAPSKLTSVFILSRCVMEDFIHLYYVRAKGWNEEIIIKHTSNGFKEYFKLMREVAEASKVQFEDKLEGMLDHAFYEKRFKDVVSKPEFAPYLKNGKFVSFDKTSSLIPSLPITDSTRANFSSFIAWKQLSSYVHWTVHTLHLEVNDLSRDTEIKQLKMVIIYIYKIIDFIVERLIENGFTFETKTDLSYKSELFEGTIDMSNWKGNITLG